MAADVQRYPRYKRTTSAIILVLTALWAAYVLLVPNQSKAAGTGIANGQPAPEFELTGLDGKNYKLSDFRGKGVMINFWATWCPPCRAEMPIMEAAYKEYESKGFVILAVNLGESEVAVQSFKDKLGITFPILMDKDDHVTRAYDIVPLPTSYFVDKNGIVQGRWQGEISKDQLKNMIQKILP